LFLERPAAGFLGREVDLHGNVECAQEIAENDACAFGRLISTNAIPEAETAQVHVEKILRIWVGAPAVGDRRRCGRTDGAGADEADEGDRPKLFACLEHLTVRMLPLRPSSG